MAISKNQVKALKYALENNEFEFREDFRPMNERNIASMVWNLNDFPDEIMDIINTAIGSPVQDNETRFVCQFDGSSVTCFRSDTDLFTMSRMPNDDDTRPILDMLTQYIDKTTYEIFGKTYNSLSRQSAYMLVQNCLQAIHDNGPDCIIRNPANALNCGKNITNELYKGSYSDSKNINAIFAGNHVMTAKELMDRILLAADLSETASNDISMAFAQSMENVIFAVKQDYAAAVSPLAKRPDSKIYESRLDRILAKPEPEEYYQKAEASECYDSSMGMHLIKMLSDMKPTHMGVDPTDNLRMCDITWDMRDLLAKYNKIYPDVFAQIHKFAPNATRIEYRLRNDLGVSHAVYPTKDKNGEDKAGFVELHDIFYSDIDPFQFDDVIVHKLDVLCYNLSIKEYGRLHGTISHGAAYDFIMDCFNNIMNNPETNGVPMKNPIIDFKNELHNGKYMDISDADFENKCSDLYNIGRLFGSEPSAEPLELIKRLLPNILNESSAEQIAKIMAEMSNGIEYKFKKNLPIDANGDTKCTPSDLLNMTPKEIYDHISKYVVHQESAKRAAAMLVYNHARGHGRNIIMAGPTGCGKTEIWRSLSELIPCIQIVNGPQLTAEGWKGGNKISDIFTSSEEKNIIVVIDEADKIFEPMVGGNGCDYSKLMQNELLKLMDHTKNNKMILHTDDRCRITTPIDAEKISIVLCGSFERMLTIKNGKPCLIGFTNEEQEIKRDYVASECNEQDLIDYANIRIELAGRINQIVALDALTEKDFEAILDHPTASPIKYVENDLGIEIKINKKAKAALAKTALDSKLGCRMVKSKILQCVDDVMFEHPDCKKFNISDKILKMLDIND